MRDWTAGQNKLEYFRLLVLDKSRCATFFFFFIKTHQKPERRQLEGIRVSSAWPFCWEFLRWMKLAGGVQQHPLEQSHSEPQQALDVPNDWREQEQHRVGCANTFIILWYPPPPLLSLPMDWVDCLQPPTVVVECTDVSFMRNCSHCSTASILTEMPFALLVSLYLAILLVYTTLFWREKNANKCLIN